MIEVTARDGRTLRAYDVPVDDPVLTVVWHHGTPNVGTPPEPLLPASAVRGIRWVSYDRPGYGGSTPHPGRDVASAAGDVAAVADALGLDTFAVLGHSGGGPHALACAALLPERVTRTAVLVCFASPEAPGLEYFQGMNSGNTRDFAAAAVDPLRLAERLRRQAERTLRDPESLLEQLEAEMAWPDRQVVQDMAIRRLLALAYRDALRGGPDGWIDDVLALSHDWGFDLSTIAGPVRMWHGEQDNFAPAGHTRWLARQIPHAELLVQSGAAHFGAVEILPSMLDWLATG